MRIMKRILLWVIAAGLVVLAFVVVRWLSRNRLDVNPDAAPEIERAKLR